MLELITIEIMMLDGYESERVYIESLYNDPSDFILDIIKDYNEFSDDWITTKFNVIEVVDVKMATGLTSVTAIVDFNECGIGKYRFSEIDDIGNYHNPPVHECDIEFIE